MANTQKPVVTKKAIEQAESLWNQFTFLSKWVIIATCVVLVIMGIVFIDWS